MRNPWVGGVVLVVVACAIIAHALVFADDKTGGNIWKARQF